MTYGIEKTSPGLRQTQKDGGVKPFNEIQTNNKKPADLHPPKKTKYKTRGSGEPVSLP